MKLSTLVPFTALLAAACAVEQPGPLTESSDIRGGSVCAPLEYPHAMSNADYYRHFESDADAAEYMTKLVTTGQLASMSGSDARFKEVSSDPRLIRLVAEVYEGFRRVYPGETAGLPSPPRIAIIESEKVNAFALGPGFAADPSDRQDQSPWLFMIHTALINKGGSDSELRGLFAHELGHLILRSFLPDVQRAIRAVYLVSGSEDGMIGETQLDDAPLAAHVEEMVKRQARVGGIPELGLSVAAALGYYPKITEALFKLAPQVAGKPSEVCETAAKQSSELLKAQQSLLTNAEEGNLVPRILTAAERTQLDALSRSVADALRACLGSIGGADANASLMAVTAELNRLPEGALDPQSSEHAKLLGLMLDVEKAVDAESTDASLIDRILRAEAPIRSELIALRETPEYPVDRIRIYDYEEDADDTAVRVLTAIGDDPTGLGTFLLDALMPAEAKTRCVADVAAGKAVPFGRFIDPHPATCWRYYHITQVAKALSQCGPTPSTARSAPRGSGRSSVLDTPAQKMFEKGYGRGQR